MKDTVEPDLRQEYTAVLNDYENLKVFTKFSLARFCPFKIRLYIFVKL